MVAEAELVEHRNRVGRKNLLRRAAGIKREHDRNQPAHDMRVAVATIPEDRRAVAAVDVLGEPDLADAALYLVLGRMLRLRQRFQGAAEFDDVAVAVVPLFQKLEIVPYFVDLGHAGPCSLSGQYR